MHRSSRAGLTPSETLITAAIVAAFALVLASRFADDPARRGRELTIQRMETVVDALEKYAIDNGGVFPTTDQGLSALVERPTAKPLPRRWEGPYAESEDVLIDAWGVPLHYVSPGGDGRRYDLWSNGADQAEGGEGPDADVQSWRRASMIP
ncbi:MAG: type II secretion system major pseudopilin GspG [Armatimonadota bacterium]|nr:type II secretion system major pseudopilin GspG [Armatimonadota bacterium]